MPDIKLLGAVYPDVPAVDLPKNGGGTARFFDVSGTTATASDVANGKLFYTSSGVLTSGTHSDQGVTVTTTQDEHGGDIVTITAETSRTPLPILMRPDAELVKKYTYDKHIVADEEVTWPGYTTTSTTLKASEDLTPTVTLDYTNYNYLVVERALSIPEYSVSTFGKGRVEYSFAAAAYEIVEYPASTFSALINSTKYTTRSVSVYTAGNAVRLIYFSSGTALTAYASAAYGVAQTITAPSVASGVLTLKSPALITRGHTTYFTSAYMGKVTDVRYQWAIEVWKAPKSNLSFNGWTMFTNSEHILGCVNSASHTLT